MTPLDRRAHAPDVWSFSVVRDARDCPRRWALRTRRTAAPALTSGSAGSAPSVGLVRGQVCHLALERMLNAHREHHGPPWGAAALQAFWRQHFPHGIVGLVREEAEKQLRREAGRRDPGLEARIRKEIDEATPALVRSVGDLLRLTLSRAKTSGATILAEVAVEAEMATAIRWRGRIDAVVCCDGDVTLIDFKTGAPSPNDMEQLTAYACMFALDPRTRELGAVRQLAVLYSRGSVDERGAPVGDALEAERARFARESLDISRRLAATPPEACPDRERCGRCDVRGACDAYWEARAAWGDGVLSTGRSADVEISVTKVLDGGRALLGRGDGASWFIRIEPGNEPHVPQMKPGSRARIVGATLARSADRGEEWDVDVVAEVNSGGVIVSAT